MDVRVRCCSLTKPAADGSIIGQTVVQNYLNSEEYKLSIDGKLTLGYLTHRGRSLDTISPNIGNAAALKKCIGKDDMGLLLGSGSTFTHYVKEFYIDDVPGEGPWLCAVVHILDEKDGFDDEAASNIKRLKALIRSGVKLTCSLVVVAYWDTQTSGIDICKSIKKITSLDWTCCPSFGPLARITEVIDDEEVREDLTKTFSELDNDQLFIKSQPREGELRAKTFSDISQFGLGDIKKTSKVDGIFTKLKVKEYSSICTINIEAPEQKEMSEIEETPIQKEFTMAQVKERLREIKMGPRMYMRRLYMSYKQMVKSLGGVEKMSEGDLKILKSLFTSDVLNILNSITPEIIKGKQINTLLGLSSLSKTARVEGQKLQIPLRMAHIEAQKQGYVSKMRYTKLQEAYVSFIHGLIDDVFGVNSEPLSPEMEAEMKDTENNNE